MYLKYRLRKGIKFYLYSNLALAATWIFFKKSFISVNEILVEGLQYQRGCCVCKVP